MKLCTYFVDEPRIGVADDHEIWDIETAVAVHLFETERLPEYQDIARRQVPADMPLFIRLNHGRLEVIAEALTYCQENRERLMSSRPGVGSRLVRPLDGVRLMPPVLNPHKFVCCGNSYRAYLELAKKPKSEWPKDVKISFLKPSTALIGHGETIEFPPDSEKWDYENELCIVIGKTCSDVSPEDVGRYVFGYSILNDACVRDIPSWTGKYDSPRGKAGDTFAPFGPYIVPAPYLNGDPNDLRILTTVDGEVRQDVRTSGLLWPVERMVSFVSRYIKLLPGDVIATGSGPGNALTSGKFLKVGQVIRCEIENIGVLENRVGQRKWTSVLPPSPSAE